MTEEMENDNALTLFKTVKGNHSKGDFNQRQVEVIHEEVLNSLEINNIGIVAPYNEQVNRLRATINHPEIQIDTVHKYQGREKETMIISTVADKNNEFADNANLINVAVSRAVKKLVVVVTGNEENINPNISDLVSYIEYNNFEIVNSNIYSVFDLLYKNYSKHLLAHYEKKLQEKTINKEDKEVFKSEQIMHILIEQVLNYPEYNNLDIVMHQPLKMLINNTDKLDKEEFKYGMNDLTHTDFLIFNTLSKKPILVIEVDGYTFHENNPEQKRRDKLKDRILEKYSIPILRLPTNGSNEERKLVESLNMILKREVHKK